MKNPLLCEYNRFALNENISEDSFELNRMVVRPLVGKINIILSNSILSVIKLETKNFNYAEYVVALVIETQPFFNMYFTHDLRLNRNRLRIYFQYKRFSIDLANCSLFLFFPISYLLA